MSLDINQEIQEYFRIKGAYLLDVRVSQEYKDGHIPSSINVPLEMMEKAEVLVRDKDTPVFIYCQTGSRGWKAVEAMEKMGYTKVKDIGGIAGYRGKLERTNG